MTTKQLRRGCWFFFGLNAAVGIVSSSLANFILAVVILFYILLLYKEGEEG